MLQFWEYAGIARRAEVEDLFGSLYGQNSIERNINRYSKVAREFQRLFKKEKIELFSSPGRTEIAGNHTDHNGGVVLAASVNLDTVCAAAKTDDQNITMFSEGFPDPFRVDLHDLTRKEDEKGTTLALIRGVASRFKERGYTTGGFDSWVTSDVPVGSGLSSSASIEVLIATVLNHLYNHGNIDPLEIAGIGQYAENYYFGKPCGLMDQIACAVGGVVKIDFADLGHPSVNQVQCSLSDLDYLMLVVDTGSEHADLTKEYSAVIKEMRSVARALGRTIMREVPLSDLCRNIGRLRSELSDRAILRAYHFIKENERVKAETAALEKGDTKAFLDLVRKSGDSSAKWLQNTFSTKTPHDQRISLALALSEDFIEGRKAGAFRVHGGGFAGTIQGFIHKEDIAEYRIIMEEVFGKGSLTELQVRPWGAVRLKDLIDRDV